MRAGPPAARTGINGKEQKRSREKRDYARAMASVLLPQSLAVLASVRKKRPLFSNNVQADLFEARHTRGPFKVLPSTEGGFVVFDTRAALGDGVVEVHGTEDEAHAAVERIASTR